MNSHQIEAAGRELVDALEQGRVTLEEVRAFFKNPTGYTGVLPVEMIVGGRRYDLLGILRGSERTVIGKEAADRVREMSANLGQEDGEHILRHQQDIPEILQGKVWFVFLDWRHPHDSQRVYYVRWDGFRWVSGWRWYDDRWYGRDRALRHTK